MDNIFIQKSIVMGIGAMTEDDLDLSDSSIISIRVEYNLIVNIPIIFILIKIFPIKYGEHFHF